MAPSSGIGSRPPRIEKKGRSAMAAAKTYWREYLDELAAKGLAREPASRS
jgi:hypothetical protein